MIQMSKKEPEPDIRSLQALQTFEDAIGGREALHLALSYIKPDPKIEYVIGLIADPRNDTKSLAKICVMGGISIGELLDYYKEAKGIKAQMAAMDAVYSETPKLAQEIVQDGLSKQVACEKCDGDGYTKKNDETILCKKCEGSGKIRKEADFERVKLAADIAGLLPKLKPAPAVQISSTTNNNTANFLSHSDLKAFREASDRTLYARPSEVLPSDTTKETEIVDAEVIPEKSNVPS